MIWVAVPRAVARAVLAIGITGFAGGACRSSKAGLSTSVAPTAGAAVETVPSSSAKVAQELGAGSAGASSDRHVLLGRIVDFGEMKSVDTLVDAPDEEVSDPSRDVAVLLSVDSTLWGFRLSTGRSLWKRTTEAPCRHLILAAHVIYAGCGGSLYAFAEDTGDERLVDKGPDVEDPVVTGKGEIIASVHGRGRVSLFHAGSNARLASRVLPELDRAFHRDVLARPDGDGVCVLGLSASAGKLVYRAGCYDDTLGRSWTKSLPVKLASETQYEVRQLGPRYLVLDDQTPERDPPLPREPGAALLLRWHDGEVALVPDHTFATIEDPDGRRLLPAPDVFTQTRALDSISADGAGFPRCEAVVASDQERSYAIIVNRAAGLAGIDRKTGHLLFLVPISLGDTWALELTAGYPIVRTRFGDHWRATVHAPTSGVTLYQDVRPRARGY